ncbi:MAG: AraC family transcriptional regulator [Lentisphaeria bacterium]|nr:AraC family transcriptional regulator [Lentisphaeria bacterium]
MNYFSDITFVTCGQAKDSVLRARNRFFEGYYGLQFLYGGTLTGHVDDNPQETVSHPAAFITFPGVSWNYESPEGMGRDQIWLCFKGPRVERYLKTGLLELRKTDFFRIVQEPDAFRRKMEECLKCLNSLTEAGHGRAVLLLEELLWELATVQPRQADAYHRYRNGILKLQERIAAHPSATWDFQSESAKLFLSYAHFRRLFRQYTNCAPGQYLLQCRLRESELALTTTTRRIGEIAIQCGFVDEAQFSRLFQKHKGMAPREYRRRFSLFD